jgi:hypothetical protein
MIASSPQPARLGSAPHLSEFRLWACPVVATFVRSWTDEVADEPDHLPHEFLYAAPTTRGDGRRAERAWMCLDWIASVHAPTWLDRAHMDKPAIELTALPPLRDAAALRAYREVLLRLSDEDEHVWDDACALRRNDVLWEIASSVAWNTARSAACDAAWLAAREAAAEIALGEGGDQDMLMHFERAASTAAAFRLVFDAVLDAAIAAAAENDLDEHDRRRAITDAAQVAAGEQFDRTLRPTIEVLRSSAMDLLEDMIAVDRAAVSAA